MNGLLKTAHKLIINVSEKHQGEWVLNNERLEGLRVAMNALLAVSEEAGTYDWDIDALDDRSVCIYVDVDLVETNVHGSAFEIVMNNAKSLKISASPEEPGQSRLLFTFPDIWNVIEKE